MDQQCPHKGASYVHRYTEFTIDRATENEHRSAKASELTHIVQWQDPEVISEGVYRVR